MRILSIVFVIAWLIFTSGPLYIMLISSFKNLNDIFTIPPKLIPYLDFQPTLESYRVIFTGGISQTFFTSLLISGSGTIIALVVSLSSAYGFSRFPRALMNDSRSFFNLLTLRMVPPFAVALPILIYWSNFKLYDTHFALIWTYTVFSIPLGVWLLKGFIDDVPKILEEAAKVDGYKFFSMFRKFILPIVAPGLAATVALLWIFLWNEFLFALKIAGGEVLTYTVKLTQLRHSERILWNVYSAMGVLSIIPSIIILLVFRKYVTRVFIGK